MASEGVDARSSCAAMWSITIYEVHVGKKRALRKCAVVVHYCDLWSIFIHLPRWICSRDFPAVSVRHSNTNSAIATFASA